VKVSDRLRLLINQKLQEYIDDKGWFFADSKPVSLSITITQIETASTTATILVGPLAPPGMISGEAVISIENKPVGNYKIDAKYTTVSGVAIFADLDDRIAGKFASLVMEAVRQ